MARLWCRHQHGGKELCDECRELCDYSLARLENCMFGENKTKCHTCSVHCYKPLDDFMLANRKAAREAQRILTLHDADIIVSSKEGYGTTFLTRF